MSEEAKQEKKPKQPRKRRPGAEHSRWYGFLRILMAILTRTISPIHYIGRQNIPEKGPVIYISNHKSMMDPLVIAYPVKGYDITFMGKKELVHTRIGYHVLTDMHMIIVDRHNSDMEAMRTCMQAIRAGESLGIFPEGTRHHQGLMDELESGVGLIAMRANVPLIPVYITPKFHFFHRTRCYFGSPIDFSDLREQGLNKDTCAQLLERITALYARMAEEDRQGKSKK